MVDNENSNPRGLKVRLSQNEYMKSSIFWFIFWKINDFIYHTRAIITRGLYIFYPILEGQKRFFKELFS